MHSVADDLRADLRRQVADLSATERLELALELGKVDLQAYQEAHGLDRETALRHLSRRRQAGRRHSRSMEDLLG